MSPTPLPPDPQRSREELLGIVRTRATVLRRRRRAALSGTMALVLAVLGGGVILSRGLDSGPSVRVTAGQGDSQPAPESSTTTVTPAPETTSSSSSTTTSTARATTSTTVSRPVVTPTTVKPDGPTTTSTEPPICRNSTDPRCGPFRWDPEPTRSDIKVQVALLTEDPIVGKPVNFKVVADEPDTRIDSGCYDYTDGMVGGLCTASYAACPDQGTAHGPWTPPEKTPDHLEMTPAFTYEKPGTYTVRYTFHTAYPGCHPQGWTDPYADSSSGEVTFTVRAPAENGTSTTSSSTTSTTPSSRKPG